MRTLSANQPAAKKAVKEMIYVDTIPMIVSIVKEKLTLADRNLLKAVKHDFKESKKNVEMFLTKQTQLAQMILKSSISPSWESVSFRVAL